MEQSRANDLRIFKRFSWRTKILGSLALVILILVLVALAIFNQRKPNMKLNLANQEQISLPEPVKSSETSIEEALQKRRSIREYRNEPLTLSQVSQILWAAQGISEPRFGGRTAPSAGALYPLEIYLAVRKAENLEPGVYHYLPANHCLEKILKNEVSAKLAAAALDQAFIMEAPVILIITGVYERTKQKYGERGIRYVHLEAGHAAQNVCLEAQSLKLGTVTVGAFDDKTVQKILNLSSKETPLYFMPIGKPR